MRKIAIVMAGTRDYLHAAKAQFRAVLANITLVEDAKFLFVHCGDASKESSDFWQFVLTMLPKGRLFESDEGGKIVYNLNNPRIAEARQIQFPESSEDKYEIGADGMLKNACLKIAQMRTLLHDAAISWGADLCWSLDSDVIPPPNALRCSLDMLNFDAGYYSIAFCPYPSQGGGGYLGGRGTHRNHILPNEYDDEKQVPDELKKRMAENLVAPAEEKATDAWKAERDAIASALKACPPKGNVFALNAEKWRPRGWLDHAYPAIGKGAILPSDWCGFGCTLMNGEALRLADFSGYDGHGTEDLYVIWKRWYPAGMRICVIPHCPASHVLKDRHCPGKHVYQRAYHELEGEAVGHMRIESRPWYDCEIGEQFDAENNGKLSPDPSIT